MKKKLVKLVRKILPSRLIRLIERFYRKSRLMIVNLALGNPSKGLKTIAITGTNGKTTTLNFINEILKSAGYKTAMFTTATIELAGDRQKNELNATVPTTREILSFIKKAKDLKVDYLLLELTSHALDQFKIPKLELEVAIFTNLTQDHLDYHKDMQSYARAKSLLWKMIPKFSILNIDDNWFDYFDKFKPSVDTITYGTNSKAKLKIVDVTLGKRRSDIKLAYAGETIELATSMPGRFNVYNVSGAVACAKALGIDNQAISDGIAHLERLDGRQERIENGLGIDILVDYAHTPDSLEKILIMAREISSGKVRLVFGATGDRDKTKRPIMGKIAVKYADRIYLTDEESYNEDPKSIRNMILSGVQAADGLDKTIEISDRREAIRAAIAESSTGDIILVTGMGHENFRIINGKKIPWNDGSVIQEILVNKK